MAATSQAEYSIALGLAAVPEVQDPKTFGEFLRVYNAIKGVMSALDRYTGMIPPTEDELSTLTPAQTLAATTRNNRVFLQAGEALNAGRLCYLKADGKVYQTKLLSDPPPPIASNYDIRFFVGADCEADAFCVLYTKGVITVSSAILVPGQVYGAQGDGYLDGSLTDGQQVIGYALSPTELWFEPQIRFYIAP